MTGRYLSLLPGLLAAFVLAAALLAPGAARADAIDGDWCYSDGRHMTIDGPAIVTPAGTKTSGLYDRHAFSYTVPEGEADAGSTVSMVLIDDDTLHVRPGEAGADAPPQTWRRCRLRMS